MRQNDHAGVGFECFWNNTMTSSWARRRLKSPASPLFTQPFIRVQISKLRVTGLCAGNSPVTGEFPAQMASNAENVSIWWRHHEKRHLGHLGFTVEHNRNRQYIHAVWAYATNSNSISWVPTEQQSNLLVSEYYNPGAHEDVMTWKSFPHHWPFLWKIYSSYVALPHKEPIMQVFDYACAVTAWLNFWIYKLLAGERRPLMLTWRQCNAIQNALCPMKYASNLIVFVFLFFLLYHWLWHRVID